MVSNKKIIVEVDIVAIVQKDGIKVEMPFSSRSKTRRRAFSAPPLTRRQKNILKRYMNITGFSVKPFSPVLTRKRYLKN